MRAFAARSPQSSYHRLDTAEQIFDYLMMFKARWAVAVVLLLAGVALGTAGNFLGMA